MKFGAPLFLWILPAVALLLLLAALMRAFRAKRLDRLIAPAARTRILHARAPRLGRLRQSLFALALLLTAFALARPQWGFTWRDARREGLDILAVIDTSNSMRADDFSPSRLQRAKWGIEELIGKLRGDRVGLIAFAGEAQLQCPLTLDYAAFMMHLQDVFPGIVPRGGTDLATALRKAADSFEEQRDADRVILLITDGESHTGDLEPVLKELSSQNIRVFAIGVGTPEGSLIPDTEGAFLRNRSQEVVKSSLDEATLRKIASRSGGLYVRADPRDFGVNQILEQGLAPLKRAQLESARVQQMMERFPLFLGLAVFCLFLEAFARVPALLKRRTST